MTGNFTVTATAVGNCGSPASQTFSVTVVAAQIWYADADNDNYGAAGTDSLSCSQPAGFVSNNADCDDADPGINPAASEILNNGIDENCNGTDSVVSSINETASEIFGLYPNPGNRLLNIFIKDKYNIEVYVSVMSADGKVLWKHQVSRQAGLIQLDTQNWPAGFYIIKIESEAKKVDLKWLKLDK